MPQQLKKKTKFTVMTKEVTPGIAYAGHINAERARLRFAIILPVTISELAESSPNRTIDSYAVFMRSQFGIKVDSKPLDLTAGDMRELFALCLFTSNMLDSELAGAPGGGSLSLTVYMEPIPIQMVPAEASNTEIKVADLCYNPVMQLLRKLAEDD
jgi:hypothetical protein